MINKKTVIEKVEQVPEGLRITALLDLQALSEEFAPYYDLKQDIRRAVEPILTKEILKQKDEIIKKVIVDVNWPEIVRSEVAQRVIKELPAWFTKGLKLPKGKRQFVLLTRHHGKEWFYDWWKENVEHINH